jgi:hypothetical protein
MFRSPGLVHLHLLRVILLLALLISRKMVSRGNLSCVQVASSGIEGCVMVAGVSRCAWEAVYSADFPSSKPSSATSILWCLDLASIDDWEVASATVTNESLKAL